MASLTMRFGMTKMMPMNKQAAKIRVKPGPKPKAEDLKVLKKTVSLQPQTYAYLMDRGGGVLSKGIECVVAELLSLEQD